MRRATVLHCTGATARCPRGRAPSGDVGRLIRRHGVLRLAGRAAADRGGVGKGCARRRRTPVSVGQMRHRMRHGPSSAAVPRRWARPPGRGAPAGASPYGILDWRATCGSGSAARMRRTPIGRRTAARTRLAVRARVAWWLVREPGRGICAAPRGAAASVAAWLRTSASGLPGARSPDDRARRRRPPPGPHTRACRDREPNRRHSRGRAPVRAAARGGRNGRRDPRRRLPCRPRS